MADKKEASPKNINNRYRIRFTLHKLSKYMFRAGLALLIFLIIWGVLEGVLNFSVLGEMDVVIFGTGFVMVGAGLLFKNITAHLLKNAAAKFVPLALEDIMDRLEDYDHNSGINKKYLNEPFGFPSYGFVEEISDYVKGVFRGIPIEFGEFKLGKEVTSTNSDGERETKEVTVFQGLMALVSHGRNIGSRFTVTHFVNYGGPHSVKTESEDFNRAYSIIGENQHDVFYVMTPHYMEKLMQLDREGISVALRFFEDGRLILVVYNMDLFEAGKSKNAGELMESIKKDMDKLGHIFEVLEIPKQEAADQPKA